MYLRTSNRVVMGRGRGSIRRLLKAMWFAVQKLHAMLPGAALEEKL